ncbi:hypothetical protein CLV24_103196 [Pontibacter ummariensis]|uniref:Uncharacterized protein n=1 Tax=Pontibacter ummariensis TaxID=1610492 RepID=A0A239CLX6_9BACT|nr:hypothetical protein [Pontibacter ummariensis]PRY14957.1 hypothetical protein CLV24_103196 [Pontibacter ummariensis]SNS20748.1 hypothetical protein SAMN06296052_103117 [Pontibacter ummariensis]
MPYKHTKPSTENEGSPSGRGQSKAAGGKPVDPSQTREEHEELKKKYTSGPDDVAPDVSENNANVITNNPNRNLDKPDINKGSYN